MCHDCAHSQANPNCLRLRGHADHAPITKIPYVNQPLLPTTPPAEANDRIAAREQGYMPEMAAENDDAKSFKSTAFKSSKVKSKWHRVFKEREQQQQSDIPLPAKSLTLNDDVADFLRPSTSYNKPENVARPPPKIDIAIAQRWPTAHQLRTLSGTPATPNGFVKPRRRLGLRVGFVNGDPEFIAEGGDESEEPPIEIARRKAMKFATGEAWAEERVSWQTGGHQERPEDSPRLNRTPTGHAVRQDSRSPTTYARMQQGGAQAEAEEKSLRQLERYQQEREHRLNLPPPQLKTRFSWEKEQDAANAAGSQSVSSPRDPTAFAAKKKELGSSEGMALRRADAMMDVPDDDEEEKRESVGLGVQLPQQHYDYLARSDPSLLSQPTHHPQLTLSPESLMSPAASSSSLQAPNSGDASGHSRNESWKPEIPPRSPMRQDFQSRDPSPIPPHLAEENFKFAQMHKFSPRANGSNVSLHSSPAPSGTQSPQPPPQSWFSHGTPSHSPAPSTTSAPSGTSKYFKSQRDQTALSNEVGTTSPSSPADPLRSPSLATTTSRNFSVLGQFSGQQGAMLSKQSSLSVQDPAFRPSSATSSVSGYRSVDDNSTTPYGHTPINGRSIRSSTMTTRSASLEPPGSATRPSFSPMPSIEGSPQADLAYANFSSRVSHMKGVFRLTAEKERPSDHVTPSSWLRAALWWYRIGKAGLEVLLKQRQEAKRGQVRELLTQPHVDLAKAWWILSDPLEKWTAVEEGSPSTYLSDSDIEIRQSVAFLKGHMKSLALSTSRTSLMPPRNSLIQGQDTKIWVKYPHFARDAMLAFGNLAYDDYNDSELEPLLEPLHALPLSATENIHCFGRFPVDVSVNTADPASDRVKLPCILTMLRYKRDFGNTIVISSQSELINMRIGPWFGDDDGLTWYDVTWEKGIYGMSVRLPGGYQANVRMPDQEFRFMWNLLQYSHKVEDSLRPGKGETLVHEAPLAELQYADPTGSDAFPKEKVMGARAYVFERSKRMPGAVHERKVHIGYRLVLVTDPKHKSLAYVNHHLCFDGPLYFEYVTDSAAGGMAAMVLRIFQDTKQFRALLVFMHAAARQEFTDVLNGVTNGPNEIVVGKMALMGLNIEPATQAAGFTAQSHEALHQLQWQKLGVNNTLPSAVDMNGHHDGYHSNTIESESLRVIARHSTGCITDRINLSPGDLLLRLPCTDSPSIQIYREAQEDLIMSIDMRHSPAHVVDGITQLLHLARLQPTVRTFNFATFDDLHAFQAAITDRHVRYDGLAATFSISRRRMVVPIYKKWEAHGVRLQVVSQDSIVQVLAFMEGFSHTDAMCFFVKSIDVFENIKGDGKGKKWAVRLVDAKFTLPHIAENSNDDGHKIEDVGSRARRRFVNLDGLEYAEEHDDLVVGFDTVEERDRFAAALPAAATVARGITLKRRT